MAACDTNKQLTGRLCSKAETLVFEKKKRTKHLLLKMHGFYIMKTKLSGVLEIQSLSSCGEKYFSNTRREILYLHVAK